MYIYRLVYKPNCLHVTHTNTQWATRSLVSQAMQKPPQGHCCQSVCVFVPITQMFGGINRPFWRGRGVTNPRQRATNA